MHCRCVVYLYLKALNDNMDSVKLMCLLGAELLKKKKIDSWWLFHALNQVTLLRLIVAFELLPSVTHYILLSI